MESSSAQAAKNTQVAFCECCGTAVVSDFLSIYSLGSRGSRLLCKKCKRMRGRKEAQPTFSESPFSPAASSEPNSVFGSPVPPSPVSPLMAEYYAAIVKTRKKLKPSRSSSASSPDVHDINMDEAEVVARFLVEKRKQKGLCPKFSQDHVYETSGAPEHGEDSFLNVVELLECLFEKPFPQPEKTYKPNFYEAEKYVDIADPQGNEHRIVMDTDIRVPFLWQSGGTFVYPNSTGITVRDFEKDRVDCFVFPVIPYEILKAKCPDLGFDKVEPLPSSVVAERAFQRHIATLPSPDFLTLSE